MPRSCTQRVWERDERQNNHGRDAPPRFIIWRGVQKTCRQRDKAQHEVKTLPENFEERGVVMPTRAILRVETRPRCKKLSTDRKSWERNLFPYPYRKRNERGRTKAW